MKPPDDLRDSMLGYMAEMDDGGLYMEAWANPDRWAEPCRVYWGSHGCGRPHGHDGPHWCAGCCDCDDHPEPGCVAGPPYYGFWRTRFYGEDVTLWLRLRSWAADRLWDWVWGPRHLRAVRKRREAE